jgi:hypothetical protein
MSQSTHLTFYNRAMEQPTAGIVHDLGNLIQVASSALSRVARDPSVAITPALELIIAGVNTALQRASALVRETMSLTRESPRKNDHFNVHICLSEIEAFIQCAWDTETVLEVRAEADLPAARCDYLGLQTALLNLVFNAHGAKPRWRLDFNRCKSPFARVGKLPDRISCCRQRDRNDGGDHDPRVRSLLYYQGQRIRRHRSANGEAVRP